MDIEEMIGTLRMASRDVGTFHSIQAHHEENSARVALLDEFTRLTAEIDSLRRQVASLERIIQHNIDRLTPSEEREK